MCLQCTQGVKKEFKVLREKALVEQKSVVWRAGEVVLNWYIVITQL